MGHSIVIFFILASSSLASAYTAPSTLSKFSYVLSRAKLQAPGSNTAASASQIFGFSDWFFHLQGGTYMQFQMKGSSARSELRQLYTNGNQAAWSVTSTHRLRAEIAFPTPASGLTELTILQVHCGLKPALRVSWRKEYKQDGHTYRDVIISNVRDGLGDKDVIKKFLAQRSSGTRAFEIRVSNSKVSVFIDGNVVLNEQALTFWEGEKCYFKAGVYVNNPTSNTALARTKFRALVWY